MAVVEKEKFTVLVPDFTDEDQVNTFVGYLQEHTDVFGVKKLLSFTQKYQQHIELAEKFTKRAQYTASFINGTRIRVKSDKTRSTAQKFYESLNTPGLRGQCTLLNVDYDSFDSQEAIIDTLVEKYMVMRENGKAAKAVTE